MPGILVTGTGINQEFAGIYNQCPDGTRCDSFAGGGNAIWQSATDATIFFAILDADNGRYYLIQGTTGCPAYSGGLGDITTQSWTPVGNIGSLDFTITGVSNI